LRVNPSVADVKFQMSLLYVKSGRLPDALRLARELEQADPKSASPPLLRGIALLGQNGVDRCPE